jgi:hypothetical protein
VQATYYSFTNEFAGFANHKAVAYSDSNYAIPGQILQGVGRLSSVKRHFLVDVVAPPDLSGGVDRCEFALDIKKVCAR